MRSAAPFDYSGAELDALVEAKNYYTMLLGRFAPHVRGRVVEVGAGVGTFAAYLASLPEAERLLLVEPAGNNFPLLRQRFAGAPRVRTVQGYLEDVAEPASADTLVAVNVLEHVPDDAGFLQAASSMLAAGGKLLLFVPALPFLFGTLDEAFGHHRRYTRSSLGALLERAGFQVLELRYTNLPGTLSWFVAGRILRKRTLAPRDVRLYDRWIIPLVARLERRWSPPLGQSLIAVAGKGALPMPPTPVGRPRPSSPRRGA